MSEQIGREEQRIEERARALFAASTSRLDAGARSRLARARSEAVAAADAGWFPGWLRASPALSFGSFAAALLVAVAVWQAGDRLIARDAAQPVAAFGDLDLLLEGESLELFEDLEFYAWLLEQPDLLEDELDADGNG